MDTEAVARGWPLGFLSVDLVPERKVIPVNTVVPSSIRRYVVLFPQSWGLLVSCFGIVWT